MNTLPLLAYDSWHCLISITNNCFVSLAYINTEAKLLKSKCGFSLPGSVLLASGFLTGLFWIQTRVYIRAQLLGPQACLHLYSVASCNQWHILTSEDRGLDMDYHTYCAICRYQPALWFRLKYTYQIYNIPFVKEKLYKI